MAPPIDDKQPADVARSGAVRRRSQAQASDQGRTAGTTAITPTFPRSGSGRSLERDDRCGRAAALSAQFCFVVKQEPPATRPALSPLRKRSSAAAIRCQPLPTPTKQEPAPTSACWGSAIKSSIAEVRCDPQICAAVEREQKRGGPRRPAAGRLPESFRCRSLAGRSGTPRDCRIFVIAEVLGGADAGSLGGSLLEPDPSTWRSSAMALCVVRCRAATAGEFFPRSSLREAADCVFSGTSGLYESHTSGSRSRGRQAGRAGLPQRREGEVQRTPRRSCEPPQGSGRR